MTLTLHPEAIQRFNTLAYEVIANLREVTREELRMPPRDFEPQTFVAAVLTEEHIGEFRHLGMFNPYTLEVGELVFTTGERTYKLEQPHCNAFEDLVDRVGALPPIRETIARETLRTTAIDWVSTKLKDASVPDFVDFLVERLEPTIKTFRVVVPIMNLHVQEPLIFGRVLLEPILPSFFERLGERAGADVPESQRDARDAYREWLHGYRKRVQGHTGAVLTLTGEHKFVIDLAVAEASHAIALLRFFTPEAQVAQARSFVAPNGLQPAPSHDVWLFDPATRDPVHHDRATQKPMPVPWRLSKDKLALFRKLGFDDLSTLARGRDLSPLERTLEESLLLFSRASVSPSPTEKLVFLMVALENLLLRNPTEPIQQNVGDRLAFALSRESAERRRIGTLFRASYELRSSFVHHGKDAKDLATLSELLETAWLLFYRVLVNRGRWATKADLLNHIDDIKYS